MNDSTKVISDADHKEYFNKILNPEYVDFKHMFDAMTTEEAVTYAAEHGVDNWLSEHNQITKLRVLDALLTKFKIEKYRPEYRSHKARYALWQSYVKPDTQDRG